MVVDDLLYDESQEFLREFRIEPRALCQTAQARHLLGLTSRVGWRHAQPRLQLADLLRAPETLGQHMDDRRIDVIDTAS